MKCWELHREDQLQPEEWAKLRRFLNEKAELALLHGAKTAVQDRAICFLAIWTGLRRSELANLNVDDLYLTNDRPYIVVRKGKGDKYREVLVSPDCRAFLKSYLKWRENTIKEPTDALFVPQRGARYSGDGIYRTFVTAIDQAGLPHRSIHKTRHFAATKLYEATKDLRFVQKQLGHSRITTSQVYADITKQAAEENLQKFDKNLRMDGYSKKDE